MSNISLWSNFFFSPALYNDLCGLHAAFSPHGLQFPLEKLYIHSVHCMAYRVCTSPDLVIVTNIRVKSTSDSFFSWPPNSDMLWDINLKLGPYIWVRSRRCRCGCLVNWLSYHLIAKPGNKTATPSWPDPFGKWHDKARLIFIIWWFFYISDFFCMFLYINFERSIYRRVSNRRCSLVGNKIVGHSDVVGASPVGAAPTTSSFSTE